MKFPGFVGPAYTLQNTLMEAQRCVNMYPQLDESGTGKNVANLLRTPGLHNVYAFFLTGTTTPRVPIRALFVTSMGRVFAVSGNILSEITSLSFVDTVRGTLLSNTGRVSIADNGKVLMIVDGVHGYQFDLTTNVFTVISGFPGGTTVTFLNGYFVFNQPNTQVFWITGLYSTTIDPLDFASAESSPDNLQSLLSDHGELWLFGTQTIEVWFNSGDPNFPFSRNTSAQISYGTPAPFSPAKVDNTVYWLGQDASGVAMVWKAAGYQPIRCSTHAIEAAMRTYPTLTDATSYTYQMDGHSFYVLNFPSGDATWVFDAATQLWHERAFLNLDGTLGRHRAEIHIFAFGQHIVSDYSLNFLYSLDPNTYIDGIDMSVPSKIGSTDIALIRTTPYISSELMNLFISKIQLDIQVGQGGPNIGGLGPQCMLSWSDDGGNSYSNEYWVSLGALGEFHKRAIWRRLGRSRQRIFMVKITDPAPICIVDCFIEVEAGTS